MTTKNIRPATRDDLLKVYELIKLQHGEKETKITLEELLESAGFGDNDSPPVFTCFVFDKVSKESNSLIGYVVFYWSYSTWEGKSLEIQDFYLKPEENTDENQLGLLKEVLVYARKHNCARVDYHISKTDEVRKQLFYNTGAVNLTQTESWLLYTFDSKVLKSFK